MFAEKVEQYTQGRYKVQVYPAGQLANDPKSRRAAAARRHRLHGHRAPAPTPPTSRRSTSTALPYLVETYEQGWKLYDESKWMQAQFAKGPAKGFRFLADLGGRLPQR